VFCDGGGRITTREVPSTEDFEVCFIEVFEPAIPAGYVSRKNFKKCYEDSLASVDGVTPHRVVNNGSQWRAKRTLQSVLQRTVDEGTVCTVYASSATGCRLMLPSGGDLGNIGIESLRSDFYYVEDSSTCLVKLRYYRLSGKYYSEGHYLTKQTEFYNVLDEVSSKLIRGDNPGLADNAVLRNDFSTSVHISSESMDIPHVITAQVLCAEIARRSKKDPMAYVLSLSTEALALYERHHRNIASLLPDDFEIPKLGEQSNG